MVTLSNFNGLLEMGFALNALTLILETAPILRDRFQARIVEHNRIQDECYDKGLKSECSWGHAIVFMYSEKIVQWMCCSVAGVSLLLLFIAAFFPQCQLWGAVMLSWLCVMFACPVFAYWIMHRSIADLDAHTREKRHEQQRSGIAT